jgi:antitoxin VapB
LREFESKIERLREWLAGEQWDAVEITRFPWLSWLLGGAEARVLVSSERGSCSVVVTATRAVVVANNIEAPRLREEEIGRGALGALPLEWVIYNWWEPPPRVLPPEARIAAGIPVALRLSLVEAEIERARGLGRDAAEVLEAAARGLRPGLSEFQIASRMGEGAIARGIVPIGLFVAADERGKQFRHPLPTSKAANRNAILSLVARRSGLHVSVTRTVSFGPACEEMRQRHRAVSQVHAAMLAASRPGARLADVLAVAQEAYRQAGFPDEWREHHQGGIAGYEAREVRATPDSEVTLQASQMVAWNPTIRGSKSEETALVTSSPMPELLTCTGNWPELAGARPGDPPLADILVT